MKNQDLAIIGFSGRFPEAKSIDAFYENLKSGVDSVKEVSDKRIKDTGIDRKEYQLIGFLEDIDKFDYQFFNIPLGEAQYIDPHQRMLLEVTYETLESTCRNIDQFAGTRTSVYLADTDQQYYRLAKDNHPTLLTGNLNATTAGRISRFFNFTGNAVMIDTACSSSLVALYLACNDLMAHQSDCALVGGATIMLYPPQVDHFDERGIDSPDFKAKTFSAAANGTSNGEAIACVMLKRLDDAVRDKDKIHAVIKGIGVNQDGARSSSLTAPSAKAQSELIEDVYRRADVNPESIGYIEAHGTGTPLGDPIEIEGLTKAFKKFTDLHQYCAISSVKTNVGHTDTTAGITGLIKAILSLKHKVLFPSVHFDEPNPFIDFFNSPVYVNDSLKPWEVEGDTKRMAALSSFGISGTNCHTILEEWTDEALTNHEKGKYFFTVSAKTQESLYYNVKRINEFLDRTSELSLADVCYSLAIGRKHYGLRYSAIVSSLDELKEKIYLDLHSNTLYADQKIGDVWLIFPPVTSEYDSVDDGLSKMMRWSYFSDLYNSILASAGKKESYNKTATFQYAYYTLLKQLGISSTKLVGLGSGSQTIQAIKGELEIQNLVDEADDLKGMKGRLNKFLQTAVKKEDVVLMMSPNPGIFSQIKELQDQGGFNALDNFGQVEEVLLPVVHEFYNYGYDIQFEYLKDASEYRKVDIPGYAFLNTRCWIPGEEGIRQSTDIEDWFYQQSWSLAQIEATHEYFRFKKVLLISTNEAFASKLKDQLVAKDNEVHVCLIGVMNKTVERTSDLTVLKEQFLDGEYSFDAIISAIDIEQQQNLTSQNLTDTFSSSVEFQFRLLQVIAPYVKEQTQVVGIGRQAFNTGHNDKLSITQNVIAGMFQAYLSEFSGSKIRFIDFSDHQYGALSELSDRVIAELNSEEFYSFCAYRGNERYIQQLDKVPKDRLAAKDIDYSSDGLYLITGGAQGVGSAVTKMVAQRTEGHVVVLGRAALPPKENWTTTLGQPDVDVKIKDRIFSLLEAQKDSNAEILYVQVDVADQDSLSQLIEQLQVKYGQVRGAFHLAGTTGPRLPVDKLSLEEFRNTMSAKTQGTLNLWDCVDHAKLDFFVLFSSFNSVLPQLNSVDYTASNAFLDAFGSILLNEGRPVTIVNWGAWAETGAGKFMDVDSIENQSSVMRGWKTEEGLKALNMAMNAGGHYSVVDINLEKMTEFPFFQRGPLLAAQIESITKEAEEEEVGQDLTPTEEKVYLIWKDVLGKKFIPVDENFFEMGGHSLLASRIINRLIKDFDINLTFRDMVLHPTIRQLGDFIESMRNQPGSTFHDIPKVPQQAYYETSPAQRRMWAAHESEHSQTSYNLVKPLLLHGDLNLDALERAVSSFLERHEILRTNFLLKGDKVVQEIQPPSLKKVFQELDFSALQDRDAQVNQVIQNELSSKFDLKHGPLIKIKLIRLDQLKHVLCFSFHHMVSDAWSAVIMPSEIITLYNAYQNLEPNPLIPLRIQYKDYSSWFNQSLYGDGFNRQKQYWQEHLSGWNFSQFPPDFEVGPKRDFASDKVKIDIRPEVRKRLIKLSNQKESTVFVTLLTSIYVALSMYVRRQDLIVGMPVSGRTHPDLDHQMGFFVNMLPLRARFSPFDSFSTLLTSVNESVQQGISNQDYPLESMIKDLGIEQSFKTSPLFEITVTQNVGLNEDNLSGMEMNGITAEEYDMEARFSPYELNFDLDSNAEGLYIEYHKALFKPSKIELLAKRLENLIEQGVINPDESISELVGKTDQLITENKEEPSISVDLNFE